MVAWQEDMWSPTEGRGRQTALEEPKGGRRGLGAACWRETQKDA